MLRRLPDFAARIPTGSVLRRIVDVPAIVDHLASSLRRELDFRLEAANADRLREAIAGYPLLGVPRIHHGLASQRLLVMELVDGVPIREAPAGEGRQAAARQLLESYYRQILEDGFRTGAVFLGYWWWVVSPGLLIVLTSVTFMLLALAMEPIVNPRLRRE